MTALLVIAILVFLIVVHELGHFIAAKLFGVRVEEFGVGYPPRAFLFGRFGGTEYTLNWIPFGGFVRLFGEEEEHGHGSFSDAPRWKQAIILMAGVTMNAIAAWVLFTGAYMVGVLHPVDVRSENTQLIVSQVVPASPADAAGLRVGDEIAGVREGDVVLEDLSPVSVSEFVSQRAGREIEVSYIQEGTLQTGIMRPAHAIIPGSEGRPAVGMGLLLAETESMSFSAAVKAGFARTIGTFRVVWDGLSTIVIQAIQGKPDLTDVVGPVGLVGAVGEAASNGWGYVLSLAAFISVNLTIINLLPVPALDGGRLVIVAVESAVRRRAPKIAVQFVNAIGLALVIMLMVTVTYHDVARLIA
ncbi:MAG: site-2 protease family protein [Candidatus Pacebacteria bacterium]|nr:site-2 protease family protein [Candidatus Paceibacterota bacterium]